ncbi:DNA (cytosine-5)-methyltransferase DRM2-like protein [Corchorus capsularis]|uniref:DNA (Cytosine-5)-methyltransferase DRM2-like protein n=1 Tax=Corchorus capsularis TaxID=210143 RepID=A0A1R3G5Q6_COCAP|nr:DNA (cytosine-5)-methyltransferase DRM2-like protein [Corchorus capsularis]
MSSFSNGKSSSGQQGQNTIVPKPEMLDFDFPDDALYARQHLRDNAASSSGSNVRSFFIGMGFLPSLVDKVIEEKGEDDTDLLLETLINYSDVQKANTQSSEYRDSLLDYKDGGSCPGIPSYIQPKEEPDAFEEFYIDKRASLLMMNFSVNEVDFALDKLGEDTPVNELVDFIAAAQIAEELEKESEDSPSSEEENDQNITNETLFGTMEKTLRLLEMGFSENEVSIAIEKFGSEIPMEELADAIFTGHVRTKSTKLTSAALGGGLIDDTIKVEIEDCGPNVVPLSRNINLGESSRGKRPKEEDFDDFPVSLPRSKQTMHENKQKGKRPKHGYVDDGSSFLDPTWLEEKIGPNVELEMPNAFRSSSCKSLDNMIAKPPYFVYGNVVNASANDWAKISQFLYGIQPELVNAQFYSAVNRKEGYIDNLPSGDRFHILPKSPLTIQDTLPHAKKWWPSWDTRKQFTCVGSEVAGVSNLYDRLGKMIADCRGQLSSDQQKDILRHCQILNLIWVGQDKLGVARPEHWEHILGYPLNHTQAMENNLSQRIQVLKQSFQIDALVASVGLWLLYIGWAST